MKCHVELDDDSENECAIAQLLKVAVAIAGALLTPLSRVR